MPIRFAGDKIQNFNQNPDGSWSQSPELKNVLGIMQEKTDVPLNIEIAPSPMMMGDTPAWGSDGGVYITGGPNDGKAFVDPLSDITVGAHEAAHQGFMTDWYKSPALQQKREEFVSNPNNFTEDMVNKGATLRAAHELYDKPVMLEEANAQGIATGAMEKAGYPVNTSGWDDMYQYPAAHRFGYPFSKSSPAYTNDFNKSGIATFTRGEGNELTSIEKSHMNAIKRQFNDGYLRFR